MALGNITKLNTLKWSDYAVEQTAVEVWAGIIAVIFDWTESDPPYTEHVSCATFSYDVNGILTKLDEQTLTGFGEAGGPTSAIKIVNGIVAFTFSNGGFTGGYPSEGMVATISIGSDGIITPAVIDYLQYTAIQKVYGSKITHAIGDIYAITFARYQAIFSSWVTTVSIDSSGDISDTALDVVQISSYREISHVKIANGIIAIFYMPAVDYNTLETRSVDYLGNIGAVIDTDSWGEAGHYDPFPFSISGTIYACCYREAFDGFGQVNTFDIANDGTINAVDIDTFQFQGGEHNVDVPIGRTVGGIYSSGISCFFYPNYDGIGLAKTVDIAASGNIGASVLDTEIVDAIYADYTYIIKVSDTLYIVVWSDSDSYGQTASLRVVVLIVPTVQTNPATKISIIKARVNGTLIDDGGETCDCSFEWGRTITYGNITPTQSKTTGQIFSQDITIAPGYIHHFRAKATNSVGTTYGNDRTFIGCPLCGDIFTNEAELLLHTLVEHPLRKPIVTTGLASDILRYSATLNGALVDDGDAVCSIGFEWGLVVSNLNSSLVVGSGRSPLPFSLALYSLLPDTKYYFRAFATNSIGVSYGAINSFITEDALSPISGLPGTPGGTPIPPPGTLPPLIPGLPIPPVRTVLDYVNIGLIIGGTAGLALIILAGEKKKKKKKEEAIRRL